LPIVIKHLQSYKN